ncbi:PRC-barrel domain-containing protein [Sporosarcina sp. HYO08]|uniref:PRC-barrel domain-containing protein n=1 Tax=Sporosarcina sp. HYO08 TaxID=1759557 RepID=UPI0007963A52|nr:YlmC/YmxH family sporulation protein [Sporosarcina sp. HYO08]KXH79908.1 hypothetical protein AU377_10555 [Sporosarcina sp. HYO08]
MRFSDIQKKEVIDAKKGSFMGFIQDATIDISTGKVKALHIGGGEGGSLFSKDRQEKKVPLGNVTTIGKDIILVDKES